MKIRVMLVDDHQIVREGIRSLLEKESDIEVVGEASNGRECLAIVDETTPDIVIMDITMPEMNGCEATWQLRNIMDNVKVLALSMSTDRRQVHEILRAGAKGFLVKDSAFEELVRAIKTIMQGNPYLSPSVQEILVNEFIGGDASDPAGEEVSLLSHREREVLQLIAEGLSTKEIATKLDRCIKTIETHRTNIMSKVGVHNIAQLTKYAIQEGLTSLDH
jgi:DNA-binding NarL/FixJ family response regulator